MEEQAKLPLGTITIHCPKRTTAQKIANVFLTKPDNSGGGNDVVCKLKDIHLLDDAIFRDHESAVKAVEKMYSSMWRLVVYVAPEHLIDNVHISKIAARVISQTIDVHRHSGERDGSWPPDPTLAADELAVEPTAPRGTYVSDDSDLTLLGEILGEIGEEISNSTEFNTNIPNTIFASDGMDPLLRARMKDAILEAIAPEAATETAASRREPEPQPASETVARTRTENVITTIRAYVRVGEKRWSNSAAITKVPSGSCRNWNTRNSRP